MDHESQIDGSMEQRWASSYLAGGNAAYVEELYESYLQDPDSVSVQWRRCFETLPIVNGIDSPDISHTGIREKFRQLALHKSVASTPVASADSDSVVKQRKVLQLINAYRFRGHQVAKFDPLDRRESTDIPELTLTYHDLQENDLDTVFDTGSLVGPDNATLREILQTLQVSYCHALGVEYMHITDTEEKRWLQQRLEAGDAHSQLSEECQTRLLERTIAAEALEHYLHTKYVGQKRFSLEGAESLIPLLDTLIQRCGTHGLKEIIVGMAHRGRLNVLTNIMGKKPADLFLEFEGKHGNKSTGTGDVKYHMGFSSNIQTPGGHLHLALAFNPSHLEIVGPVVEGSVRARQMRRGDKDGSQVMSVLIHGDAAFAGQGVVMETINMSQSRGFSTKGTLHIVINNQIGFTTSAQQDARSTLYCTDVAKMVGAPIFHVNGDDPEAVFYATQIAVDYRMTFRKDVVIDLVCYRRHGHSEADEPMATQPMMYQRIKEKSSTPVLYAQALVQRGVVSKEEIEMMRSAYWERLDGGNTVALDILKGGGAPYYEYASQWHNYMDGDCKSTVDTTVSLKTLRGLWRRLDRLPKGLVLHPSVQKIVDNRRKMAAGALPVDWGFAEISAYASLVEQGYNVRLSGQDSGRGTFFHRHAILSNQQDGSTYIPLRRLSDNQGTFMVTNSLLSEAAVLAFEYGYATTDPETLTIWEAQFGDFANNAQVVIDQFISAGEQKWDRLTGLVMFLPHGYEGQGPEHSSARLERYLQLCAQENMQVCVPTTASQIFHLLRRQMLRRCRKPLIVMTPKSLLRHHMATSSLEDLTQGQFETLLPEAEQVSPDQVDRVILCSGKVYYDLVHRRRKEELGNVAIMRIEQLFPFPHEKLSEQLAKYKHAKTFIWCQEEPKNQGAWYPSQHHMRATIGPRGYLEYAGRPTM
ncbi:MAG: 2-oxoglutarate dehydrogenase E1 component, partial [Acidiferrobacterales bacterium]